MTAEYDAWIGRTDTAQDEITPSIARRMALTLDAATAGAAMLNRGDPLPPLWHWLGFAAEVPMSGLGADGHPARGGFLPPVPLERRMWAGGRVTFHGTARIGVPLERRSEILRITEKTGGAGRMVFVTVRHDISDAGRLAISEEHDIVYVAMPERFSAPPPVAAPSAPLWLDAVPIDPVRLFRYSALTFNGHRIHYDLAYAQQVEKYPGLVVHGPLQATLMMEAARRRRGGAIPATFRYRGVRPLIDSDPLDVLGMPVEGGLQQVCTATGGLVCMQGEICWSAHTPARHDPARQDPEGRGR